MTRDEFMVELSKTSSFEWTVREGGKKVRAKIKRTSKYLHDEDFPEMEKAGYYYACPISAVAALRAPKVPWGYVSAAKFLGLNQKDTCDIIDAADSTNRELKPIRETILAALRL